VRVRFSYEREIQATECELKHKVNTCRALPASPAFETQKELL